MKLYTLLSLTTVLLFSSLSYSSENEEWKKFLQYKKKFYLLSNEKFSKITCKMSSPLWTELFKNMREDIGNDKNLKLTETLSSAKIDFYKTKEIRITLPTMDIKVLNSKDIPQFDKVEAALDLMKKGFKQQADRIGDFVKTTFQMYLIPNKLDIKIEDVNIGVEKSIVHFERDKFDNTHILEGNTIKIRQVAGPTVSVGEENYEDYKGKLLFKDSLNRFTSEGNQSSMKIEVEYQTVGSMKFPEKIKSVANIVSAKNDKSVNIDVSFSNCKWSK